jgi:serine/threonine-protein kinase
MGLKARVWTTGRGFVLKLGGSATYGLFTVASMRIALRVREVDVPRFVGLEPSEAAATASNLGLTLKLDDNHPFDPKIPAGRIATQDPPPGVAVRRGRSVRVWISAGSREGLVPRLIGETERTATATLQQDGLSLVSVAEIRSADLPADTVIGQDPEPGSRSVQVALLVNRGERAGGYVMPDLIGVSGEAALALLRSKGLRVTIVAQQPYPGVPPGFILRQYPTAGFEVTPDQPISLEVSR